MDGAVQTAYPRKNWSSLMLFNCDHPSVKALTPEVVNRENGAYLHRLQWAEDSDIGALPVEWNWLEGWTRNRRLERQRRSTSRGADLGLSNGRMWIMPIYGLPKRPRSNADNL